MSLEQLIEQDMIKFLDNEVQQPQVAAAPRFEDAGLIVQNKDWEKEVKLALKHSDIEGAKRLFNQLKEHYNNIPVSHTNERTRTYAILQDCYIAIINSVQEHTRTKLLLTTMETSPTDVFNANVKPVDLQHVEHIKKEMPELPPLTRDALNTEHSHPIAEEHQLKLPPHPLGEARPAAAKQAAKREIAVDPKFVKESSATLNKILQHGKTDPTKALAQLDGYAATLKHANLPAEIVAAITARVELLRTALQSYKAKKEFTAQFNHALAEVMRLARMREGSAIRAYGELYAKATAFETAHPVYAKAFTQPLTQLKEQYALYNEDELVERIVPFVQRITTAARSKEYLDVAYAVKDLHKFSQTLPHTHERTLIEKIVVLLKNKFAAKLALPAISHD